MGATVSSRVTSDELISLSNGKKQLAMGRRGGEKSEIINPGYMCDSTFANS